MQGSRGFTLVEVIVALVILAVLSLLTAESMRSAISQRASLTTDLERDARLADALRIIRADVAAAFNHRDILVTMINQLNEKPQPGVPTTPNPDGSAPTPNPGGVPPTPSPSAPPPTAFEKPARPTPPPVTAFVGESDAMYFTTLSNVRLVRDAKESDQAKIAYFVKSCTASASPSGKSSRTTGSRCLFRAISPFLNNEIKETGPESVLLEHVEEFKLRYFSADQEEPVDSWPSEESNDSAMKGKFPDAVEITLTIHNKSDPKDKPATATILAPVRFPNNPTDKKNGVQKPPGS
jgi:prepilin-type N-terminal cleavage/methylation domain-containing protein